MSTGPWKDRPVFNAYKAYKRATKHGDDAIEMLVNTEDKTVCIRARLPNNHPQPGDKPLDDGGEIIL
jgi:hypothetical protein